MVEESYRVEEEVREGEVVESKFSKKEKARGRGKSKTKDPTLPPITDVRATKAEPSSGIDMSEERILGVEAFLGQQEQRLEAVERNLKNLESTTFDGLDDIKETVTELAEEHREGIRALAKWGKGIEARSASTNQTGVQRQTSTKATWTRRRRPLHNSKGVIFAKETILPDSVPIGANSEP
ncbi:hypothetical protein HAX54_053319 [Datura stramonium]|uniref:Uncharacterized protein n=1 Tax=Datura stramonium TaxID=4076 RepID=A0ABS8WPH4_DATST|nr:hypothetical protein [Datura stramonium]